MILERQLDRTSGAAVNI